MKIQDVDVHNLDNHFFAISQPQPILTRFGVQIPILISRMVVSQKHQHSTNTWWRPCLMFINSKL